MKYTCKYCGSNNVFHDAWAIWNEEANDFEVVSVFDHTMCANCDQENVEDPRQTIKEIENESKN